MIKLKFEFKTKNDIHVAACESKSEQNAWQWLAETKKLTIKQAKDLYHITEIK